MYGSAARDMAIFCILYSNVYLSAIGTNIFTVFCIDLTMMQGILEELEVTKDKLAHASSKLNEYRSQCQAQKQELKTMHKVHC